MTSTTARAELDLIDTAAGADFDATLTFVDEANYEFVGGGMAANGI